MYAPSGPQACNTERAASGGCRGLGLLRRGLVVAGHHAFDEALHVHLRDAALRARAFDFGQRHAEFARELADGRRSVGQRAFACARLVRKHRNRIRSR